MNVHFSSKSDEWATPPGFAEKYGPFDLDPAATAENAKAPRFYTKAECGLTRPWSGRVWLNPPYGRTIGLWVKKAYEASLSGAAVICLLPARTDTRWWHDYVLPHGKVEFLKGRLKFGGCKNSAPFPSAVVTFTATPPNTQTGKGEGVMEKTQSPYYLSPQKRLEFWKRARMVVSAVTPGKTGDGRFVAINRNPWGIGAPVYGATPDEVKIKLDAEVSMAINNAEYDLANSAHPIGRRD